MLLVESPLIITAITPTGVEKELLNVSNVDAALKTYASLVNTSDQVSQSVSIVYYYCFK